MSLRELKEDIKCAEIDMDRARKRLNAANTELIHAEEEYGNRLRRLDALQAKLTAGNTCAVGKEKQ